MKATKIFSFDVGMTSLGVAVNEGGKIVFGDVLLMHPEAGAVKVQAERRRLFKTRESHKAREAALESLWRSVGLEPLQRKRFEKAKDANGKKRFVKTSADERLEREFPRKGDDTVYASSLLCIMLLEGEPLEDWQIYKALHAAIQRRGYDSNVPWKTREEQRKESVKDENPEEQVGRFDDELRKMTSDKRCHLPAYYDAWKMGLWDAQTKRVTHIRQHNKKKPQKARGYNPSRELVTQEICRLLDQASEQIPQLNEYLTEDKRDQLLYGKPHNTGNLRYPSFSKVDGLLGQKYPRFENRIVSKCALMPRLNVCKSEKPLAIEVGFLLRLVDWRYEKEDASGEKSVHSLSGQQISDMFNKCESAWKKQPREYAPEEYAKCFRLTPSKVAKMADELGGSVKEGHAEIPASKHTGRSRFSQPALHLMKSLILSDKTPKGFGEELTRLVDAMEKENPGAKFGYQIFPDVPYKYFRKDFKFLNKMGDSRDAIYVPDISLAERYRDEGCDVDSAVQKVINTCNWPELRHRLGVFDRELEILTEKYGKPDAVHLEFVREDFLSKKRKNEYTARADAGKKARQTAVDELKQRNIDVSEKNIFRYRLYEEQNKQCAYTGDSIDIGRLESYEIDHIFPREDGGPDAYYNKVLTSRETNQQKGKHLPCECGFINWSAFGTLVKGLPLGKSKKKLLLASTREEAEELVEKYTGLSGTAHIARLARDIACLRYGWQPGAAGEQQHVFVFSGGLTSKVAKKYGLYKVLGDGSMKYQKDRTDHRHHALDAMVISYLRQWTRDKNKTEFFKFPPGIDVDYFREALSDVYPHYITRVKPAIAEQPKSRPRSDVNKKKKEFKNISKDPEERGQWYTNKSESGKGTSQHGYIFYKDDKGKVCSKTIHSFRSPYAARKEVEKKSGEIIGLLHQGKSVFLPGETQVTGTKLGRNARLKFGEYEIVKLQKETVIRSVEPRPEQTESDDSASNRYRITRTKLAKIEICNELMLGNSFDLDEFPVSKEQNLTGNYRVDNSTRDLANCAIVNTGTGEMTEVEFFKLVQHLDKIRRGDALEENNTVTIGNIHATYIKGVKADDLPRQNIPDGHYLIKGFRNNGNSTELVSQDGTVYRMQSNQLDRFIIDRLEN
ncbi:MAG: hypothetical protein OXU94_07025 [Gammaproteobacteria bacterium]|nr:hypothetical protein [Gammaproteobacteria bacterium]